MESELVASKAAKVTKTDSPPVSEHEEAPGRGLASQILNLQRKIGNRATTRIIETKLRAQPGRVSDGNALARMAEFGIPAGRISSPPTGGHEAGQADDTSTPATARANTVEGDLLDLGDQPAVGEKSQPIPQAEITPAQQPAPALVQTRHIQRQTPKPAKTADADKTWADDTRGKVRQVKSAATDAAGRITSGAGVSVKALRASLASYTDFEKKYNAAVDHFTKSVKEAIEKAEEMRKQVGAAAELAFTAATAGAGAAGGMAKEVAEAAESLEKVAGVVNASCELIGAEPQKPEVKVPPSADIDWKKLIETSIDTLDHYQTESAGINAITKQCDTSETFLSDVIEGKGPANARAAPDGQAADKVAQGAAKVVASLGAIKAEDISEPATKFQADCAARLDPVDGRKLEQDIAMKWISGLKREQLSTIDDIDGYLKSIGLIDEKGNRLGVDTGAWTTELDTQMIWMRSQIETAAMALVGKRATWMGGGFLGGQIRDDDGEIWYSNAPSGISPKAGGEVVVNSYKIAALGDEYSEWSHPNVTEMREILHDKVRFTITPVGETGGGVSPLPPSFRPAPGGSGE